MYYHTNCTEGKMKSFMFQIPVSRHVNWCQNWDKRCFVEEPNCLLVVSRFPVLNFCGPLSSFIAVAVLKIVIDFETMVNNHEGGISSK